MKTMTKLAALAASIALALPANAATFTVNQTVGTATVTGRITTDGTLGVLATQNITAFDLLLDDGSESFRIDNANAQHGVFGNAFSATATGLLFDYNMAGENIVIFQNPQFGSSVNAFCFNGGTGRCQPSGPSMVVVVNGPFVGEARSGIGLIAGEATAAVPEPATWAMMIIGFGAVGTAMRRRPHRDQGAGFA